MKKLIFLMFFSLSLIACTSEEISEENISQIENQQTLNQDIESTNRLPMFSVESDLVSVDDDCFILNVRIYLHNETTGKLLIANQNVETGDVCSDSENMDRNNIYCDGGTLLNGDRALPSKLKSEHCLTDFLNNPEHEGVYGQYLEKKSELLNSL
ncbi:hypothetical protein [Haloflavibacter putidus]|uniref:Lipoprotein n=1 Tax=Haloflavibacter putidus TaxID=2576776 RepID=A0A507ZTG4_9FLAO|nr:hypothetical protein [Haloflavibacter putidus]TQD40709.1 hypothetical protein FKR84_01640 [Haloflavibacter putidus]